MRLAPVVRLVRPTPRVRTRGTPERPKSCAGVPGIARAQRGITALCSSSPDARSRREAAPGSQPSAVALCLSPKIQRRRTVVRSASATISTSDTSLFIRRSPRPRSSDASCRCAPQAPALITSIKIASCSTRPKTVIGRSRAACSIPFAAARERQAGSRDGLDRRLLPVRAISSDDDETPEAGRVPALA